MMKILPLPAAMLLLAACQSGDTPENVPGDGDDTQPFSAIAEDAKVNFAGTEPFWGGDVEGDTLRWSTPENVDGIAIDVERFAGRGGLSYTGMLEGEDFTMAITPGDCSDGMSDRTYPFVVTVTIGESLLAGCGWREGDDLGPPP